MNENILSAMKLAALAGGEVLLKYFSPLSGIAAADKSSHADIITVADPASQTAIKGALLSEMVKLGIPEPEIGFIGEEDLCQPKKHLFIIDPLDGTTDYASGLDYFCISIGYAFENQLMGGVVYDPIRKTFFVGSLGQGSFIEDPAGKQSLAYNSLPASKSLMSCHLNLSGLNEVLPINAQLIPQFRAHRSLGSLALELCYMAKGVFSLVINANCYDWDLCAAKVILNELGLEIYHWDGTPYQPDFAHYEKLLKIFACPPEHRKLTLSSISKTGLKY